MKDYEILEYLAKIKKRLEVKDTDFLRKMFNKLLSKIIYLQVADMSVIINESHLDIVSKKVADFFGLEKDFYNKKTRKREIVQARQILHSIYVDNSTLTLADIGLFIGEKDHATVIHSKKTVNNLMDTDKKYNRTYRTLISKLGLRYEK